MVLGIDKFPFAVIPVISSQAVCLWAFFLIIFPSPNSGTFWVGYSSWKLHDMNLAEKLLPIISSVYLFPEKVFSLYLVQILNILDSRHLMMPTCPRQLRQASASAAKKTEQSRDPLYPFLPRLNQARTRGPHIFDSEDCLALGLAHHFQALVEACT